MKDYETTCIIDVVERTCSRISTFEYFSGVDYRFQRGVRFLTARFRRSVAAKSPRSECVTAYEVSGSPFSKVFNNLPQARDVADRQSVIATREDTIFFGVH